MKNDSVLRHLMNDDESLSAYLAGMPVSFADVKRRMFLKERNENSKIPDHHYRLLQEKTFAGLGTISDIIRNGLYNIASGMLSLTNNKIFVRQSKQNDWQELITRMPPLILQAAYLHMENPLTDTKTADIQSYYREFILPNFRNTALPHPFIPQLEHYISEKKGFHDLHMHLNGSTETDAAWQNFLRYPDKCYSDLKKAFGLPKVKEQLEQESKLLTPLKFYHLTGIAQRIRQILFDFVFEVNTSEYEGKTENQILQSTVHSRPDDTGNRLNPFVRLISEDSDYPHLMAVEGLMYILTLRYLTFNRFGIVAQLFHLYLLILGLCNRLLVQQLHQYGFEQFQKHTLNGLRENTEKDYLMRFIQLHGNEFRNIAFLEGRFSPKKTTEENIELLKSIEKGWEKLQKDISNVLIAEREEFGSGRASYPELRLVAHFIKKEDTDPDKFIRHKQLRTDTRQRAEILALLVKNNPRYNKRLTGVDAAASEFDAPPEVFAPAFRMLRRKGWNNFTYHAGEDFYHLISGLRAIYEAVIFTEMKNGNRIGHATATGLAPEQWCNAIGKYMLIRKGEWLDNLIFVYHLIINNEIGLLTKHIPTVTNEIHRLSHEIYERYYSLKALEDSWLFRKYCPMMALSDGLEQAKILSVYDSLEWSEIKNKKITGESRQALQQYHSLAFRKSYDEIITVSTDGLFSVRDMEVLQLEVLKTLHEREIVIETLPTSNVRIGHHTDYSSYHLWNWIKWEEEGHCIPPIVVGTDDTGIFATNIYNEYANIYCHLIGKGEMTHAKAMSVIEKLDRNGRIYRFENK